MSSGNSTLKRGAVVRLVFNAEANGVSEGIFKNERRWVLIEPDNAGRWLAAYVSSGHQDALSSFGLHGVSLKQAQALSLGFSGAVSIYPAALKHLPSDDIIIPALGQFQDEDIETMLVALDLGLGLGVGRGGADTNFRHLYGAR